MEITFNKMPITIESNNVIGLYDLEYLNKINTIYNKRYLLDKDILKDNKIKRIYYSIINSSNIRFKTDKVRSEISLYCRNNRITKRKINDKLKEYFVLLNLDEDIFKKKIKELSNSEKYRLFILLNTVFSKDIYLFINCLKYLDKNNIKGLKNIIQKIKNEDKIVIIYDNDINVLYNMTDKMLIINGNITYDKTKKVLTDIEYLKENNIDIPELPLITYLAKTKKNVKLFYHDDVRDIIKDIYKHV